MKALNYILTAAAVIGTASCQTEELKTGGFMNDPDAVRISVSVGGSDTRSNPAGDASAVTQFNSGDRISVGTEDQAAVVYKYDGTDWTPEEGYLKWNNTSHTFEAYYPAGIYTGSETVPADQSDADKIAAADYMQFSREVSKENGSALQMAMSRQTARIIVSRSFAWNAQYMEGYLPTYKVTDIKLNCKDVSGIIPYENGDYYALANAGDAVPDADFITLTISPVSGEGAAVTHVVKGIPALKAGYSYRYDITIGKNGASINEVTVEDWETGSILNGEGGADDDVEYEFSVNAPESNFNYAGGTKNYTVKSYVKKDDGSRVPMPWTARFVRKLEDGTYEEISQGDADYPTWITGFTDKGIGANADDICAVTVESSMISNNHYNSLKNATPVSGIYNLSNASGGETVENTANCYIINAAGTYSFPLVYGNAIKNGADNKSAYVSTATGNLALEKFLNHRDEPITSPYIAAHEGCTPANAVLVWQDADNLVSNIKFVDGGSPEAHRITFDVVQSSIKQGNAIVAVRGADDTILWSWHIWVTDYKSGLSPTIMNSYDPAETQRDKEVWTYDNKKSYTFMGVPLGWCDAESAAGHEVIIQFTQIETGTTQEVTVKQDPLSTGGNCTYYQWGRKDPMLPSNGLGNVDKPHSGNYTFTKAQGKVTLGTAIQKPHEVYDSGPSGWNEWYSAQSTVAGKDFFQNLWDANDCSTGDRYNIGVKTVYDPSPVGYIVPPSDAINCFTYDGKSAGREDETSDWDKSYTDKFNSVEKTRAEVDAIKGMTFYCKGMNGALNTYNKDGGVIYFPAAGTRDEYYGNELDRVGVRGNYWTTAQTGSGQARTFLIDFDLIYVLTQGKVNTSLSLAVRPVRE